MDFEQMLRFENEYTKLDFKKSQYRREQFDNLIKDIIALANANVTGPRHIIVGVKHLPGGDREYFPISPEDFVDEATYQQLIRENIEPTLPLKYVPLRLEQGLFGVFIIDEPLDPPYVLKKDRGALKTGDGWIRIGSFQHRLTRSDLDLIYSQKSGVSSNAILNNQTISIFEQEIRWTATANANGAYFSVVVDYGRDFGELNSDIRRQLLDLAANATIELGLSVDNTYKNSTSDVIEYWTPSNQSDFHMKYHHPGVVWFQFRTDEPVISLHWLIEKYEHVYKLLQQSPIMRRLKERQIGISLANWPDLGINLNPLVADYYSLQHGKLRGVSFTERTTMGNEPNWGQFFKTALEQCLTERGYIGHEEGIRALEVNLIT